MNFITRHLHSKKSPERSLEELAVDLKLALGEKLFSLIVFGSHASGEFLDRRSSINVMVLTHDLSPATLERLVVPVRSWANAGHEPPVIMSGEEFTAMSKVLPIEFLDILDHHRVLAGVDPFPNLAIDRQRLTFQIEHDLTTLLLKLRRSIVLAGGKPKNLMSVLARSVTSAWTLCRAILRADGESAPMSKINAANRLSEKAGFDRSVVGELDAYRRAPVLLGTEKLFYAYLELVEKLLHYAQNSMSR